MEMKIRMMINMKGGMKLLMGLRFRHIHSHLQVDYSKALKCKKDLKDRVLLLEVL
jgi:hypothetical protein